MVDASSESLSVDVLLQMIAEGDFFAAVERLANLNDPVAAAELYAQAALDAYWKRKIWQHP